MKSIIARMQELKENPLKALEDGATANNVEKALNSANVQLRDSVGEFRKLDDVIEDLGATWSTLDVNTQRYVATMIAGNRQQSRFLALMENFDRYSELKDEAMNSEGNSAIAFAKHLDTIEVSINRVKNAWEGIYLGMGAQGGMKSVIDMFASLLEVFGNLSNVGKLVTTMFTIITAKTLLHTIATKLQGKATQQLAREKGVLVEVGNKFLASLGRERMAIDSNTQSIAQNITAMEAFKKAKAGEQLGNVAGVTSLAGKAGTLLGSILLPLGKAAIVMGGIALIIKAITKKQRDITKLQDDLKRYEADSVQSTREARDMRKMVDEQKELSNITNKTAEEKERLREINKQIADEYPALISSISEEGDATLISNKQLEEHVRLKEQLARQETFKYLDKELEAYREGLSSWDEQITNIKENYEELPKLGSYALTDSEGTTTTYEATRDTIDNLQNEYYNYKRETDEAFKNLTQSQILNSTPDFFFSDEANSFYQGLLEDNQREVEYIKDYGAGLLQTQESLVRMKENAQSDILTEIARMTAKSALDYEQEEIGGYLTQLQEQFISQEMVGKEFVQGILKELEQEGDLYDDDGALTEDVSRTVQVRTQQEVDKLTKALQTAPDQMLEAFYKFKAIAEEASSDTLTASFEELRAKYDLPQEIEDQAEQILFSVRNVETEIIEGLAETTGLTTQKLAEEGSGAFRAISKHVEMASVENRPKIVDSILDLFALTKKERGEITAEVEKDINLALDQIATGNLLAFSAGKAELANILGVSVTDTEFSRILGAFELLVKDTTVSVSALEDEMHLYQSRLNELSEMQEKALSGTLSKADTDIIADLFPEATFEKTRNGYKLVGMTIEQIIMRYSELTQASLEAALSQKQTELAFAESSGASEEKVASLRREVLLLKSGVESVPSMNIDVAFTGMKNALSEMANLQSAIDEQAKNGRISLNSAIALMEQGYGEAIRVTNGLITLDQERTDLYIQEVDARNKASIDEMIAIAQGKELQARLEADVARRKLEVINSALSQSVISREVYDETIAEMNKISLENYAINEDGKLTVNGTAIEDMSEQESKHYEWLTDTNAGTLSSMLDSIGDFVTEQNKSVQSAIEQWNEFHKAVETGDGKSVEGVRGSMSSSSGYTPEELLLGEQKSTARNVDGTVELDPPDLDKFSEKFREQLEGEKAKLEADLATSEEIANLYSQNIQNLQGLRDIDFATELERGGGISKGGSGGSKKKEKEAKEYVTQLERAYNVLKDIQKIQHDISMLELSRELETNGFKIQASVENQLTAMKQEIGLHEKASKLQQEEMSSLRKQLLEQYSEFVDFSSGMLKINYEAIKAAERSGSLNEVEGSKRNGKHLEELIKKYDSASSAVRDYEKTILSLRKTEKELRRERQQKVFDMENRLLQALIRRDELELQSQIKKYDALKKLHESYIDSVRRMRAKEQQLLENEKDIENLHKKRQRLALLEKNTSNTYDREKMTLKEEIAEMETDLAEKRKDQLIEDLEDEFARKNEQYDNDVNSLQKAHDKKLEDLSIYWEEVERIMQSGTEAMMDTLMTYDEEFLKMSDRQKSQWVEDMRTAAQEVEAILRGVQNAFANVRASNELDTSPNTPRTTKKKNSGGSKTSKKDAGIGSTKRFSGQIYSTANDASRGQKGVNPYFGSGPYTITGESGGAYRVRAQGASGSGATGWFPKRKAYKKGGLVDYTGPAWVDGTKSDPESFLDARDTKILGQILQRLRSDDTTLSQSNNVAPLVFQIEVLLNDEFDALDEEELTTAIKNNIANDPKIRQLVSVSGR